MKAARFHGEGRITIEDAPAPDAAEGEVRVDVIACALCGSDLRPFRQGWPITPGHEIAGRVNHPGHRLHGRRVLVYIPTFCGHCAQCRAGHTQLCETAALVGWQRPGGYADALRVPERCLLELPDDIPDRLAPLLLDTVGTSAHGVRLAARVVSPGPALVIGAGPIGLGSLIVLRRMGWGPLTIREPNAYRAEMAASLGAAPVSPEQALAEPVPLVLECSGRDAARQLAFEAVAPYGAVVQLGESEAWSITENRRVRRKDYFLVRSFYFPIGDYAANVELLRADRDDFARLVDATTPLEGLETLFAAFARGERLKPLLCPT
jgi:threonine dehydrogenase-like Zn-dependent dehydrogenase